MDEQKQATVYNSENLPDDAQISTSQGGGNFEPLDDSEMYQVEVLKAELRDNPFYKPDAKKKEEKGSKYQFNFEFAVIDDGDFYGRRIWDRTGLAFKPGGKRGPTKLYKIVTKAMGTEMDWDACASFAPDLKVFLSNLEKEVVGQQLRVTIENTTSEAGKSRTKVATYMEAKKKLKAYDQEKSDAMKEKLMAKKEKVDPEPKKEKLNENVSPDDIPF